MITKKDFGVLKNKKIVESITMENNNGTKVVILTYGGILKELWTRDASGKLGNIVLGYETMEDYEKNPNYLGAIIGRTAGRLANGLLTIEGDFHPLSINNQSNTIHGGASGFHTKIMDYEFEICEEYDRVTFSFEAEEEDGYPGNLDIRIVYTLDKNEDRLILGLRGITDKRTYLNMTSHSYFNLSGDEGISVENHMMKVHSNEYWELSKNMIPVRCAQVDGTAFDFRERRTIKDALRSDDPQIRACKGIEHPFKLNNETSLKRAASLADPISGRVMDIFTTQPHLVIYSGNHLSNDNGMTSKGIKDNCGICFEAQEVPNAPNMTDYRCNYLDKGKAYKKVIMYEFSVDDN